MIKKSDIVQRFFEGLQQWCSNSSQQNGRGIDTGKTRGGKMKKVILVALLVSNVAFASAYDMECLNVKGKFSKCSVTMDNGSLDVKYRSKSEQGLNVTIPAQNIKALSAGEYSRRRVAEAVLFSPWLLFSKKKRDQVGVEYAAANNNPKGILFSLKKKYGMSFKTELKALSGKPIEEEASKK